MDTIELSVIGVINAKATGSQGIVVMAAIVTIIVAYRLAVFFLEWRRR